ncbi:hypothetical protein N7488_005484 [Penicillium malachiteum]|nr:hypothetical protein N7488_005484 [Penicillium malachiteum]
MEWHQDLGFTDRLRAIQSLTTAYQQASSTAAFAEAQAQARQYENEAYDQATSKEEYDRKCQEGIDAAETRAITTHSSSSNQDVVLDSQCENQSSAELSTGEKFGHYTACFHHFDGLHSNIYRANAEDESVRAIKITVPHLMEAPHDANREIRLLHEASHPNVVSLIETFKLDEGRLVLVFPFLRFDFEKLLRRDMVTASQARSILKDTFSALAYIHKIGIIHRDIKPSNILMDSPDGPAYLADFGISWKEGDPGCERSNEKITDVGTTCYRAPEILFGYRGYDTTLDLWAAGCVVAEATVVGHRSLFDSGPLGSDLSLIHSIFQRLGTPDENIWPASTTFPHSSPPSCFFTWQIPTQPWDDILPGASSKGRDLVRQMVCYESSQRLSAEAALQHPYFSTP